jgi:predicted transcriptional regulator
MLPMSDFKPRPGTFRAYLEYANREKLGQRQKASPITLLEILEKQANRSLAMFDLQAQSGMEPGRYADALKSLRDAGYIAIDGQAPEQSVCLTDSGSNVVRLARPA